jgi:ketosteroid isomerase-like protein
MDAQPVAISGVGRRGAKAAGALALLLMATALCAGAAEDGSGDQALDEELRAVETAFARTMADRDLEAFASFLAEEAVFFGARGVLRGKAEVSAAWARFFDGPEAPFSWAPEQVEVLDSGRLGFSTGPVFDPAGNRVGTFNSVWRLEGGEWRIVFDRGCPPCPS